MKVLIIGHFHEMSGWADAAKEYALALNSVGCDVVIRSVRLTGLNPELNNKLQEFESKNLQNVDYCLQILLPHHMEFSSKFKKNLGLAFFETDTIKYTPWTSKINLMDGLIVTSSFNEKTAKNSGIKCPIYDIAIPIDKDKYTRKYEPLDLGTQGQFLFGFIGDFNRRKNLAALIKAFHSEFDRNEPVELVIKTSKYGINPQDLKGQIQSFCREIKSGLKMYGATSLYKDEIIITDHLSEEQILQLHNTIDCLVSPTYGEGYNIPAFTSMVFGKTPICTDGLSMNDFIHDGENGWLINSHNEPAFGITDNFPFLFSGRETWKAIDIKELMEVMRMIVRDRTKPNQHLINTYIDTHSYQSIGEKLMDILKNE